MRVKKESKQGERTHRVPGEEPLSQHMFLLILLLNMCTRLLVQCTQKEQVHPGFFSDLLVSK